MCACGNGVDVYVGTLTLQFLFSVSFACRSMLFHFSVQLLIYHTIHREFSNTKMPSTLSHKGNLL